MRPATCWLSLAICGRGRGASLVCTIAYFRHDYRVGGCTSDAMIYVRSSGFILLKPIFSSHRHFHPGILLFFL